MLTQASAFVIRSLRQESRLLVHHLARGGIMLFIVMTFASHAVSFSRGQISGLALLSSIKECWYWSLLLLGSSYFSAAIVEEKEEETLPLLQMTGVRTVTLLLGKSLPRLMVVLLLMLVAAPLLLFAQAFGGVLTGQIVGCIMSFMAFAFCLNQVGLLAGTVCRNSQRAISLTIVFWVLLEFGSGLIFVIVASCTQRGWDSPDFFEACSSFGAAWWNRSLWVASTDRLNFETGESLWHPQITFHVIMGLCFFAASWLLFQPCTQVSSAEGGHATDRTLLDRLTRTRRTAPRRAQQPALVWKSWQFVIGGWPWFLSTIVLLPVTLIGSVWLTGYLTGQRPDGEAYGMILFWAGIVAFFLMTCRAFGSVLSREVQQQTLVSLCMLPESPANIVRQLLSGVLPAAVSPLLCIAMGFMLLVFSGGYFVRELAEVLAEPWTWAAAGWGLETILFGSLLSLYMRHGAMLVAIVINWIAVPVAGGLVLAFLAYTMFGSGIGNGIEPFMRVLLPLGLLLGEVALCAWIMRRIVARVGVLASQS